MFKKLLDESCANVNPEKIKLPSTNLSSLYVFAGTDKFFAYPNNYNHYVNYYKNTLPAWENFLLDKDGLLKLRNYIKDRSSNKRIRLRYWIKWGH